MAATGAHTEHEVKIHFPQGAAAARDLLKQLGYHPSERTLESDQLFDRANSELRDSGRLLRLRQEGDRTMLTYKGPGRGGPYKSREEIELEVPDPEAVNALLDRLGYAPAWRYEKFRTKFAASGEPGYIALDETPIGIFLELEGPPEWIDRTAAVLGFSPAEYLVLTYAQLYDDYRKEYPAAPRDMVFSADRPIQASEKLP